MKKNYDLTQGSILKKLLTIALPIMGTQFIQMTYNLTDMFWLGKLSGQAVAASGTVGMYLWLANSFAMFGRMGSEIGVSQNVGQGNYEKAKKYASSSYVIAAVLGIFYMAVMIIFNRPLIGFFNIKEAAVVADSQKYLKIVSLGIPFMFTNAVLTGCFNASGNSRTTFIINAVGLIVNILLDPILIFVFDMGIFGAAVATIAGQAIVNIILTLAVMFSKNRPFDKFRFFSGTEYFYVNRIIRWSMPIVIENVMFTFLSMIISRFVSGWGTGAMAVYRVGGQVESLSWLICGGFASAVTAFVGQNFGAGKWDRINKGVRLSMAAMLVWGFIITLLMFFGAEGLMGIFLKEKEYIAMGKSYLRILAACQIIACAEYTTAGVYRGLGKTLPPSVTSISVNILRVFLAYFMSAKFGLTGIWWAISLGAAVRGIALFIWYILDKSVHPKGSS